MLVNVFCWIFFSRNYTMTYIRSSLTHVLNLLNHIAALFFQLLFNDTECDNATKWSIKISASNTNTIDADIDIGSEKSSASKQKIQFLLLLERRKKLLIVQNRLSREKLRRLKLKLDLKLIFLSCNINKHGKNHLDLVILYVRNKH